MGDNREMYNLRHILRSYNHLVLNESFRTSKDYHHLSLVVISCHRNHILNGDNKGIGGLD